MKNYVEFANKFGLTLTDDKYLKSKMEFHIGGFYQSFDGAELSEPTDYQFNFDELDDFITEYFPDLSVLSYKKICKICVTNEYYREGDYYGGKSLHFRFKCDIEKMYNFLIENKFIINYENN